MKFGVSLPVQQPANRDPRDSLDDILTWVHCARDLGFDFLHMGQHFLTSPHQMFQGVPLLARLVPESGQMRLQQTVVVPLHNPVYLAETIASLDVISDGRFGLTCALGYRDEEYAAFSVDRRTRVSRFVESIQLLRQLWTQESVTFHGRHYHVDNATVVLRPLQRPHPPMWIAANADAAVARSARLGLPWCINPHATFQTIERQVLLYKQAAADVGNAADVPFRIGRELFCAPTREGAFRNVAPYLGDKYSAYAAWGQDKALPGNEDFTVGFTELANDRFIIGTPDDCIRELQRYDQLGVEHANFRMIWGGMPLDMAISGMELFAKEVVQNWR